MVLSIPLGLLTDAQIVAILAALEAEIGSGEPMPTGALEGPSLRAAIVALAAAVGGVTVPPLPLTGAQVRALLADIREVTWPDAPAGPSEPAPEPATPGAGGALVGSSPPEPWQGANGEVYVRAWDGNLAIYGPKAVGDWGAPVFSWDGGLPSPPPRNLLLEDVRAGEFWLLDTYAREQQLTAVVARTVGSENRSLTFSIWHGVDPEQPGVEVVTGGITVESEAVEVTELDAATIPPGGWLWLTTSAIAGTVEFAMFGVRFA